MTEKHTEFQITVQENQRHFLCLCHWLDRAHDALFANGEPAWVSKEAKKKIMQLLFRRLCFLSEGALNQLFSHRLTQSNPAGFLGEAFLPKADVEAASVQLLDELSTQTCAPLFKKHPLLQGELDGCTHHFTAAMKELFWRVESQLSQISACFMNGHEAGQLTDFSADAADAHNGGRFTAQLTFEGGKILYKPRDCRGDVLFYEMVSAHFADMSSAPKCLTVDDAYGFCEFIENQPAETAAEAENFYYGMGGLCAVIQMVGSCDMHMENLLAHGRYPVPVDLETIFAAAYQTADHASAKREGFFSDLHLSLYESGMIPVRQDKKNYSPLTDLSERNRCAPVINGVKQSVCNYQEPFFEGFREGYRRCIANRDDFAAWIGRFGETAVRKVLRNTVDYYRCLKYICTTEDTHETAEEKLKKTLKVATKFPYENAIIDDEIQSLLKGDIPYFSGLGCDDALYSKNGLVQKKALEQAPVAAAQTRLARMNEDELHFEEMLMRQSFASVIVKCEERSPLQIPAEQPISGADAMEEAQQIFQELEANMLYAPSGDARLMGLVSEELFGPLPPTLGFGIGGVGVFCAALSAVTKNEDVKNRAAHMAHLCARHLETDAAELFQKGIKENGRLYLGEDAGAGGSLISFALMAQYLDLPEYFECGLSILRFLQECDLETVTETDRNSGLSGLVSAICRFPAYRNSEEGRQLVLRCIKRLRALRTFRTEKGVFWQTLKPKRLISGAAHGLAGIARAFYDAYAMLGDERDLETARELMEQEHFLYNENLKTWPDFRETARPVMAMHGYCSGAPGMGLMLLGIKEKDLPYWQEDMERVIHACTTWPLLDRDHLCCGNAAVVNFLFSAGDQLKRPELTQKGLAILEAMRVRKNAVGFYTYFSQDVEPFFLPSLFYGAAGIGYTMLRAAKREGIM